MNVDIVPTEPEVIPMDLTKKWKIADNSKDAVYHSHVMEHVPKNAVKTFISECHRVLKPGGVIRVVIPDLEMIARNYIHFLDKNLENEDEVSRENYHWTLLELMDQMTRNESGGDMLKYLAQPKLVNKDFILSRTSEAAQFMGDNKSARTLKEKFDKFWRMRFGVKVYFIKNAIKNLFFKFMPGSKYYKIGQFRLGGETHQWMYDRYSVGLILKEAGFKNIRKTTATDSDIKDWEKYNLDSKNGQVYKPDSLFMEATK